MRLRKQEMRVGEAIDQAAGIDTRERAVRTWQALGEPAKRWLKDLAGGLISNPRQNPEEPAWDDLLEEPKPNAHLAAKPTADVRHINSGGQPPIEDPLDVLALETIGSLSEEDQALEREFADMSIDERLEALDLPASGAKRFEPDRQRVPVPPKN